MAEQVGKGVSNLQKALTWLPVFRFYPTRGTQVELVNLKQAPMITAWEANHKKKVQAQTRIQTPSSHWNAATTNTPYVNFTYGRPS